MFELAARTHIREPMISLIENARSITYPKYRRALSEFFGISEEELFDERRFAREADDE
jgi:transcriptional regulator with XRE-family HTH domain